MQSLIPSKSAGVTGGRGTAGAGPGRDLLYGSRGLPAAPTNRRPGDLGPYEPCPSTPRVRIVDSVETTPEIGVIEEPRHSRAWRTTEVEARREVRHLGRGRRDMEALVSMCERRCRKACNLRSAAEDSDEACHSGSSRGRARRYRKRGSPKSAARDAGAMDTDPSPVRLWESEGHSEGYRTAYEPPSEPEMSALIPRAHTAPEPAPRAWRGRPGPGRHLCPEHRERLARTWRGSPTRGHEVRQRVTPPATTTARGQVPSHNGHRVPRTREARTTHDELRHGRRSQGQPGPHARTAHPRPVGRGPRPHAGKDERSGVGERPSPDATHPGKRRPPGGPRAAPTARKASSQERALWGW